MIPVDDNEALQIGPDPDKLFVYHRQQLSAMLDGELSPDQGKFMLRRLQHDAELAACWERWQVCGDVLRGQRNALLPADFAQRVALAVAGDAAPGGAREERSARPRFARWGGGAAIAASVALLAVFASRQLSVPGELPEPQATPMVAAMPVPSAPAVEEAPVLDAVADAALPGEVPLQAVASATTAAAVVASGSRRPAIQRPRGAADTRVAGTRATPARTTPAILSPAANDSAIAATAAPVVVDPFPMPEAVVARPWPRALLSSSGTFNVADGRLAPREPAFKPFLPRDRSLSWPTPAQADPAQGGLQRPAVELPAAPPAAAQR